MSVSVIKLADNASWDSLSGEIGASKPNSAAAKIVEKLKSSGVVCAILEDGYLDRDFSAEYSSFYSTLFRKFRRRCRRVHFFKSDLSGLTALQLGERLSAMEEAGDYVGFFVVRPLKDAPIGRTLLNVLDAPGDGSEAMIEVRADHPVHLLGATLSVKCLPFMQQDTRVSACAQASIWMSARHFHSRHAGPWQSTADITEAASNPTDATLASSLPAGAGGLNINNMLRALRALDRHPLLYSPERNGAWPAALNPAAIVARYVGSGIPVIIGLNPWEPGQTDGHAIVVSGSTFDANGFKQRGPRAHNSDYMPYFLINDDQRGPSIRMPVEPGAPLAETPYNLAQHCGFVLIPLPNKVFIPAETAERVAWDYLQSYQLGWPTLKATHAADLLDAAVGLGELATKAVQDGEVVARTFLTFGWKHKRHVLSSGAATTVCELTAVADLPRMVWVTEFARKAAVDGQPRESRRAFAHCVIDATATGPLLQPQILFHAPGFVWTWDQAPDDFFGASQHTPYVVPDDVEYEPRARSGPFAA